MKILILIVLTILAAVVCFAFGSLIGRLLGRNQKKQDNIRRNGSDHV